jgi:hypothetical protein
VTEKVFPDFEGGAVKYWNEDPWIRSCYFVEGVGQGRDDLQIARVPEGS